jgi:tetratricopeptide (TPR) repeat protein
MKTRTLLVWLAGLWAVAVNAQDYSCKNDLEGLVKSVKAKQYAPAAPLVEGMLQNCPKYDVKLYTLGETVLTYRLETSRDKVLEEASIKNLLDFYDAWEKNFPGTGGVQKKALFLTDKGLEKEDEVFKLLDAAFTAKKTSFTNYNALELYYNLYLARYTKGDKGITQEQFVAKFGDMVGQAALAKAQVQQKKQELLAKKETQPLDDEETAFLKEAPVTTGAFEAVSDNIILQSAKHAGCQNLEAYYNGLFDKNKADNVWLSGLVAVMSKACKPTPVLHKGAVALDKLSPSLETALLLGDLSRLYGTPQDAVAYYEKAAGFEADSAGRAKVYITIANALRNSDRAAAKSYLLKAAAFNPKDGTPYIQLAEMYTAASGCTLTDFEKKALYWLAIETVKKATVANPNHKPTVEAMVKRYEDKMPVKEDLKAAKKSKGDTITYGCWINETVIVPKVK